jgi:hypothetical protein
MYGTWSFAAQARSEPPRELLGDSLGQGPAYRLLADEGARTFPDGCFADLYSASARGRPTVPARVPATAMVLQASEGPSEAEACDRLEVGLRWQAAAGLRTGAEPFRPAGATACGRRSAPGACPKAPRAVAEQAGAMGQRARARPHPALWQRRRPLGPGGPGLPGDGQGRPRAQLDRWAQQRRPRCRPGRG